MSATPSATIPLGRGDPVLESCRRVLANLADAIDAHVSGAVDDVDPEHLHDLRVAVRRTRSVLGQVRTLVPDGAGLVLHRPFFDGLSGVTGMARDLDVYVIGWDDYVEPLSPRVREALVPVRHEVERRRADAHEALAEVLTGEKFVDGLRSWRTALEQVPPDTGGAVGPWIAGRITAAQRKVLRDGRAITPASPADSLHALRKDAKKLRYLLECFGGLLPTTRREAFVARLGALQGNLGAHQDAQVHADALRSIAVDLHRDGVEARTLVAIGQLVEQLERRRGAAREEFGDRFREYDRKRVRRQLATLIRPLGRSDPKR